MIRILIAEDMHLVRGALVALLSLETDLCVVGAVATGPEVVPAAVRDHPDVAVLDVGLPGMDGVAVAQELARALPTCRSLIVTGHPDSGSLGRALLARVAGYLPKDASPAQLADAIRRVHRGERVLDPVAVAAAFQYAASPLTDRERDVLACVAGGADVSDVAAKLFLAPGTVRNYLSAAMSKIGARNRVDAVRIAREHGWIAP